MTTTKVATLTCPVFPIGNLGNLGNWQERHLAAISSPRGPEVAVVAMLIGWLGYADQHQERLGSGIGEDYILGPEWEAIGRHLIGLLNGETGRLDCGTLDGCIRSALTAEGFAE